MTKIYYNGNNPFAGISSTPFVGRNVDIIQYGDRWGQVETYRLRGLITGKCPTADALLDNDGGFLLDESGDDLSLESSSGSTFEILTDKQQALISNFAYDYKDFVVYDSLSPAGLPDSVGAIVSGQQVLSRNFVKVTDIAFDQSNYGYDIPFTITLQAYPSDYFTVQYGILEPKDEYRYVENDNGTLTITRTTSAKGFITDSNTSNALSNAKTWVETQRGLDSYILPLFISGVGSPCLVETVETPNRLAGTYEIKDTYSSDLILTGGGVLRYTIDYNKDIQDGKVTIEIKGDVTVCKNQTIADARTRLAGFDALKEATRFLTKIEGRSDLNQIPVTKGFIEDPFKQKISFTFVFNDDLSPQPSFNYTVRFEYDWENDLITASIEGSISSRAPIAQRWAVIETFARQINLYSILLPWYNAFSQSIGVFYPLNSLKRSYSETKNEFNYELSLSASYDNAPIPPFGLSLWDYSIEIVPPLAQYADSPCLDGLGNYTTFDLGFKSRKIVSLQGRALGQDNQNSDSVMDNAKTQILGLQSKYVTTDRPHLDSQSITSSNSDFGLGAEASAVYSCDDLVFTF